MESNAISGPHSTMNKDRQERGIMTHMGYRILPGNCQTVKNYGNITEIDWDVDT